MKTKLEAVCSGGTKMRKRCLNKYGIDTSTDFGRKALPVYGFFVFRKFIFPDAYHRPSTNNGLVTLC